MDTTRKQNKRTRKQTKTKSHTDDVHTKDASCNLSQSLASSYSSIGSIHQEVKKPCTSRRLFNFTIECLEAYFNMPQKDAAVELNCSHATLKRNCKRLGFKWPFKGNKHRQNNQDQKSTKDEIERREFNGTGSTAASGYDICIEEQFRLNSDASHSLLYTEFEFSDRNRFRSNSILSSDSEYVVVNFNRDRSDSIASSMAESVHHIPTSVHRANDAYVTRNLKQFSSLPQLVAQENESDNAQHNNNCLLWPNTS